MHAVVWLPTSTTAIDLNTWFASVDPTDAALWNLESAKAINSSDVIAGYGIYNGVEQAYTLDISSLVGGSVPEPMSLALVAPVAGILLRRRR